MCPHCSNFEDQSHCMLDCPHLPFTAIRKSAKAKQETIANQLRSKHNENRTLLGFIHQICYASWQPSPHISRLWLGTWSLTTLRQMLGEPTDTPISTKQRFDYIDAVKRLTKPLIRAYQLMLDLNTRHRPGPTQDLPEEDLPLYDHVPADTHTDLAITDPDHPEHASSLTEDHIEELALMFEQEDQESTTALGLSLFRARTSLTNNIYDLCDAANRDLASDTASEDADGPL